jgi:hypothetical protein
VLRLSEEEVRVVAEVFFVDEAEDVVVIVEVVEHHARVAHDLLEFVLFMLPPKALFLWGAHSLRIYHHQIITNFF